jgi:hypothetical protein
MTKRAIRGIVALALITAGGGLVTAQEKAAAEQDARKAMELYFKAWNTGNNDNVRATINFPFVTFGRNGAAVVDPTPPEYSTDFERMRTQEGWNRSELDSLEPLYVTADRVHFHVTFSRYKADNTKYMTGHMMYIVTRKDGHWGPQFRTSLSP